MEVTISTGDWATLGRDAQTVRYEVFVVGQNIPVELEWDEMDAVSLHAVAYDETGRAIGTARLLPDHHIGRMAVLEAVRGQGIGGLLLHAMMDASRERGAHEVMLNAQVAAMPFYRRHGFVEEGDEFDDAGIPHKLMRHVFRAR
jgi:predicted GNAT family N-acyltransferase